MTRLSRPAGGTDPGALAASGAGGGGGASGAGAGAAGTPPFCPPAVPDRGRRLRRRLAVPVLSATGFAAASTGAGATGSAGVAVAGERRPRRRRDAGAGVGLGPAGVLSALRGRAPCAFRLTLAPTSPSAHRAPSAVWTSTRQTTMAVGAPPTGGRFWVSVQRA